MAWDPTLYSLVGFGAAGVSGLVAVQAWHHRSEPGARPFLALMLALGGWSLVYAVQIGFTTRAEQLLWQRAALAVGGTVPTLWLLFTIRYAGHEEWLTPARQAALAADPVLFAALVMTNPAHGLVWDVAGFAPESTPRVVDLSFGAGYLLHIAYAYLVVAAGIGLLVVVFERASRLYRKQTALLVLGTLPPFAANVAFTLRVPWGPLPALDLTPFAFAITGVLFGLALFEFDLLERTPIARQRVLAEMGDGLVVLDADGTVVEANAIAREALDPAPTVGAHVAEIAPGGTATDEGAATTEEGTTTDTATATVDEATAALDGRTITTTLGGRRRTFDADASTLTDHHGTAAGYVIALRDVTDRTEYEQRLEVTQRVLRHNLRNDMTVIRGWARRIERESEDGTAEAARRIVETTDGLIDLSEKTRGMATATDSSGSARARVDVSGRLERIVGEFRSANPGVSIDSEIPSGVTVTLPEETLFDTAVENVLENAIEHNDADDPWVGVRVEEADDHIRIRIADDGPGIPEIEVNALSAGTETALEHGSGIGLWLAHWSVASAGGTVTFEDRSPRGSVVTIELPPEPGGR